MPATVEIHSTVAKGNTLEIPPSTCVRNASEGISARIIAVIPSEMIPPLCCDSGTDQSAAVAITNPERWPC